MHKNLWLGLPGLLSLLAVLTFAPACGVDPLLEDSAGPELSTSSEEMGIGNPPECKGRVCVRDADCVYGAGGPNPISCGSCQSTGSCSLAEPVPVE